MATKWGIASAGRVSNDFVTCLTHLPNTEHQVVAVADKDLKFSQPFATKFKIPKAYGSYKELSQDNNVEIVYISTINPQHFEVAKMMLEAGKHVLCEKPCCIRSKDVKELLALAKKKKLYFMEGLWARFFPVYEHLRQELKKGSLGSLEVITMCFGDKQNNLDRLRFKQLGGGCTLDITIYALQLVALVYNGEKPLKIHASGVLNDDGVDDAIMVSLIFSGNKIASITMSQNTVLKNGAVVAGTKGLIQIPGRFWCPTQIITPDGSFEYPVPDLPPMNYFNSAGFQYEAKSVRECLQKGLLENPLAPQAHTEWISCVADEILKQLGISFPEEVTW